MKKLLYNFLALAVIVASLSSCNEEIELIGDFEETAVIYGILDQSDSIHMIKITRAFIGPGNSLEIAQIPDSSYFNSVNATIREYVGGALTRTWNLTDTMVTNKDENGIFYAPEQKLYYFPTSTSSPLLGNAIYKINIDINNGLFTVTGETPLVSGMSTNTEQTTYSFKFAQSLGDYKTSTVTVTNGTSYRVNTTLDVHYDEFIGLNATPNSFSWKLGETDVSPNSTKTFQANGQTFYDLFATACSIGDPSVDKRNITGITVTTIGVAEHFYNYILVNQPSSSIAQNKPTYTNLTATNEHTVVGIFSAKYTRSIYHPFIAASQFIRCIDINSTRELCTGFYTSPYAFCSQHSNDINSSQPWACN